MEPNGTVLFGMLSYGTALLVAGIALLLFANRIPEMMRSLGRSVTEFKKGIEESKEGDDESSEKSSG